MAERLVGLVVLLLAVAVYMVTNSQ